MKETLKPNKTLITNGFIITSEDKFYGDILIEGEKIIQVSDKKINVSADEIIDAKGLYVIPGAVDPHVHMELDTPAGASCDDFFSGSKAAIAGGTTTIIDFITPDRDERWKDALEKRKILAGKSLVDYSLHASIVGWNEHTPGEVADFVANEGITSFKIYMAYQKTVGINDSQLALAMEAVGRAGGLVMLHAEDDAIISHLKSKFIAEGKTSPLWHARSRPVETEAIAVLKAISYAKILNCPIYVVHVSGAPAIQLIAEAQESGIKVLAETCPQYLLLDESLYDQPFEKSAKYVISPPLRGSFDRWKLWKALKDKTISVVATDHCPFNLHGQKSAGVEDFTLIPNGAGGIEHRPGLLFNFGVLNDRITLNEWVNLISTHPARIFGLSHKKGDLKPGLDADVVLWNPAQKKIISTANHHQRCDSNIYEGFAIKGVAQTVFSKGKKVFDSDHFFIDDAMGNFLKRTLPVL